MLYPRLPVLRTIGHPGHCLNLCSGRSRHNFLKGRWVPFIPESWEQNGSEDKRMGRYIESSSDRPILGSTCKMQYSGMQRLPPQHMVCNQWLYILFIFIFFEMESLLSRLECSDATSAHCNLCLWVQVIFLLQLPE